MHIADGYIMFKTPLTMNIKGTKPYIPLIIKYTMYSFLGIFLTTDNTHIATVDAKHEHVIQNLLTIYANQ